MPQTDPAEFTDLVASAPPPESLTLPGVDELIKQGRDEQERYLRSSMFVASQRNPQEWGKIQALHQKMPQLGVETISRDLENVQTRYDLSTEDYAGLISDYPGTAGFLANPNNATVSKGSIEHLKHVEDLFRREPVPESNAGALYSRDVVLAQENLSRHYFGEAQAANSEIIRKASVELAFGPDKDEYLVSSEERQNEMRLAWIAENNHGEPLATPRQATDEEIDAEATRLNAQRAARMARAAAVGESGLYEESGAAVGKWKELIPFVSGLIHAEEQISLNNAITAMKYGTATAGQLDLIEQHQDAERIAARGKTVLGSVVYNGSTMIPLITSFMATEGIAGLVEAPAAASALTKFGAWLLGRGGQIAVAQSTDIFAKQQEFIGQGDSPGAALAKAFTSVEAGALPLFVPFGKIAGLKLLPEAEAAAKISLLQRGLGLKQPGNAVEALLKKTGLLGEGILTGTVKLSASQLAQSAVEGHPQIPGVWDLLSNGILMAGLELPAHITAGRLTLAEKKSFEVARDIHASQDFQSRINAASEQFKNAPITGISSDQAVTAAEVLVPGTVSVPIATLERAALGQKTTVEEKLKSWGVDPDEYAAAKDQKRKTIEMSAGRYVVKVGATADGTLFQDEISGPYAPSVNDVMQRTNHLLGILKTDTEAGTAAYQAAAAIETDVAAQLKAIGRPQAEIEANARITRAVFATTAARLGVDPVELWRQYRPTIVDKMLAKVGIKTKRGAELFQGEEAVSPTFSALQRTLESKMPASASVEQVRGIIKDQKADEIKWSGIEDFLAGKEKVSKEELLAHLRANELQIKETTLTDTGGHVFAPDEHNPDLVNVFASDRNGSQVGDILHVPGTTPFVYRATTDSGISKGFRTLDEAKAWFENERPVTATKFSSYQLPGGTNYREVLFALPERVTPETKRYEELAGKWERGELKEGTPEFEEYTRLGALAKEPSQTFTEGHFNTPNVLAHVRINDRVDANGKKVLFLEEVQSDWHQKGREKGYATERTTRPEAAIEADLQGILKDNPDLTPNQIYKDNLEYRLLREELDAAVAESNALGGTVPDAPFRKSWHEFVMKRMIRYAAENGYDSVAWTTGEQQAERYDLSKQVNQIDWHLSEDGKTVEIEAFPVEDGRENIKTTHALDKVDEAVGKELADKIRTGAESGETDGFFTGVDLKVGGEGMKGFYDKIIPQWVDKFTKKWGGKVGETVLGTEKMIQDRAVAKKAEAELDSALADAGLSKAEIKEISDTWHDEPGAVQGRDRAFAIVPDAVRAYESKLEMSHTETVHNLSITPALREAAVEQGFPMFQGGRGSFNPLTRVISLFKGKADPSTFFHESFHAWTHMMADVAAKSPEIKTDLDVILKWTGADKWENLTRKQHEQLARGFEAYLMEGRAPSKELRGVFARAANWLTRLYGSMKHGHFMGLRLTDEVRGVMDRLLATQEQMDAITAERGFYGATPDEVARLIAQEENPEAAPAERAAYQAQIAAGQEELATAKAQADAAAKAVQETSDELWKTLTTPTDALQRELGVESKDVAVIRERLREADQRAREILMPQVMADIARKQTKEYNAKIRTMKKQLLEVMDTLPTQEAWRGLKAAADSEKLDYKDTVAAFGKERADMLPDDVYALGDGISLEDARLKYGFDSADEMLTSISQAETMRDHVDAFAKATVDNETPAVTAEQLRQMTLDAIHNDESGKVLLAEMKALLDKSPATFAGLIKQLGRRILPDLKEVRAKVAKDIAGTKVGALDTRRYMADEMDARKRALAAAGKGDWVAAMEAKREELEHHERYRAATEAKRVSESIAKFMRRMTEDRSRAVLGFAGGTYLEAMDELTQQYEFAGVSAAKREGRAGLLAWYEQQKALAEKGEAVMPVVTPELLADAAQRNYKDLKFSELVDVGNTAENIMHLARLKNRLLEKRAEQRISAISEGAVQTINANAHGKPRDEHVSGMPDQRLRDLGAGILAAHLNYSAIMRQMDGFKDGGFMWEHFVRPLNEAGDREAIRNEQAAKQLHDLFSVYSAKDMYDMNRREFIPEIKGSLPRIARIMVALNMGSEDSRIKLMDGHKWTAEQLQAIVNGLDKRDLDFVEAVWKHVDQYWPEVNALNKRVTGLDLGKVEALPFDVNGRTMTGGYFPLVYDGKLPTGERASQNETKQIVEQAMAGATIRATTRHGHREARLEGVQLPVYISGFSPIFNHSRDVIHDLTHYEFLVDANRLLRQTNTQTAIRSRYGAEKYNALKALLGDVASGNKPATNAIERGADYLRHGTVIAGLGFSAVQAVMDITGLSQAAARIGPTWMAKGLGRMLGDASRMEATSRWIQERDPGMALRAKTYMREINEVRGTLTGKGRLGLAADIGVEKVTGGHLRSSDIVGAYFWLMVKVQQMQDQAVWTGAYEKAMAEGGIERAKSAAEMSDAEKRAVAIAHQAVLDAFGGGQIKDLAGVQRSKILKPFTVFYSYAAKTFALTHESFAKTAAGKQSIARMAGDMLLLYVVPVMLSSGIYYGIKGKKKEEDSFTKELGWGLVQQALGTTVGLRELGSAARGYYGYEGPAGTRAASEITKLVQQVRQGEADAAFWHALNASAGILFHYPAAQVQRTADGAAALQEGKTENPLSLLFGPRKD